MNTKKVLSALIAAALAVSPMAVFAENTPAEDITAAPVVQEQTAPTFISSSMTVSAVGDGTVELKGDEESIVNLTITDDTLIINADGTRADSINEGDSVTYYVKGNKPAILIYPPVYTPDVIVINDENAVSNVKVDTFVIGEGGALISADGALVVNADAAVLENADGSKVTKESLVGKDLCVVYSMSTMSLPPITNPDKVYILSIEDEAAPTEENNVENGDADEEIESSVSVTNKISANGSDVFEITLVEINGRQMLPVRAVSEALGLEVSYSQELEAVTVGTVQMGATFNIGVDSYNKSRMTPFTFGQAPVKVIFEDTGVTYVPVEFFTEILDAQITLDGDTTIITRL